MASGALERSYSAPFLLAGVVAYLLVSTQGTLEAFRSTNVYWHFTNVTVGHSHLAMYGFVAFMIWGAAYGLVPRLTGSEPNPILVGIHFWLALVGYLIYVVSISTAGVLQGFAWVAGESFIRSVEAAEPMWLWRTAGGVLMVASHLVFAVNVWAMRPGRALAPHGLADRDRLLRAVYESRHGARDGAHLDEHLAQPAFCDEVFDVAPVPRPFRDDDLALHRQLLRERRPAPDRLRPPIGERDRPCVTSRCPCLP